MSSSDYLGSSDEEQNKRRRARNKEDAWLGDFGDRSPSPIRRVNRSGPMHFVAAEDNDFSGDEGHKSGRFSSPIKDLDSENDELEIEPSSKVNIDGAENDFRPSSNTEIGTSNQMRNKEDDDYEKDTEMRNQSDEAYEDVRPSFLQAGGTNNNSNLLFQRSEALPSTFGRTNYVSQQTKRPRVQPKRNHKTAKDNVANKLRDSSASAVLNMLKKYGFKENTGLGKNRDGIVEPIEVKVRGKSTGLGFGGSEKPASVLKEEKLKKDLQHDEISSLKPPVKKPKITLEKAEIAMRRVDQAIVDGAKITQAQRKLIEDDLHLILEYTSTSLNDAQSESQILRLQRDNFNEESQILQPMIQKGEAAIGFVMEVQKMSEHLSNLSGTLANDNKNMSTIIENLNELEALMLRARQGIEGIEKLKMIWIIAELAVVLIEPEVNKAFQNWNFIDTPSLMLSTFLDFKRLFFTFDEIKLEFEGDYEACESLDKIAKNCMTPYDILLYKTWLSRLVEYISNKFNPISDSEAIIESLTSWKPHISSKLYNYLFDTHILPKLEDSILTWEFEKELPIHFWFHSWLILLENRLPSLLKVIKSALASMLKHYEPGQNDQIIIGLLEPWIKIFEFKTWSNFLTKHVIPKLKKYLEDEFILNPSDQELEPFETFQKWQPLMNIDQQAILLQSFFNQVISTINIWLDLAPPLNEVIQWLEFWLSQLEEQVMSHDEVENCFREAYLLIWSYIDDVESHGGLDKTSRANVH